MVKAIESIQASIPLVVQDPRATQTLVLEDPTSGVFPPFVILSLFFFFSFNHGKIILL